MSNFVTKAVAKWNSWSINQKLGVTAAACLLIGFIAGTITCGAIK